MIGSQDPYWLAMWLEEAVRLTEAGSALGVFYKIHFPQYLSGLGCQWTHIWAHNIECTMFEHKLMFSLGGQRLFYKIIVMIIGLWYKYDMHEIVKIIDLLYFLSI